VQGEFGVISLAFGSRAKLLFRFVWPGTYEEVPGDIGRYTLGTYEEVLMDQGYGVAGRG
jgi:hypothetical protein